MTNSVEKFPFNPNGHLSQKDHYLNKTDFGRLLKASRQQFDQETEALSESFKEEEFLTFNKTLQGQDFDFVLKSEQDLSDNHYSPEKLIQVLEMILTPELDAQIKSYFGSHYAAIWYGYRDVEDSDSNVSAKWHCDGGPPDHLKTITYLNSSEEHNSTTYTLDVHSTNKLKELGYVFCDINHRKSDVSDFLNQVSPNYTIKSNKLSRGDTILFNPFNVMHKAGLPSGGMKRKCFDLCILPSPKSWKESIREGVKPHCGCVDFHIFFKQLYKLAPMEDTQKNVPQSKEISSEEMLSRDLEAHVVSNGGAIDTEPMLKHVLDLILQDSNYADFIMHQIIQSAGGRFHFSDVESLLKILKDSFKNGLNWGGLFPAHERKRLNALLEFEEKYYQSSIQYHPTGKSRPEAIFWPIPNHPKHPRNKFDDLPYVNKHAILDKTTPIGSAGSCFAFEIAKVLQEQGFNYVVTERADNIEDGVYVDGYQPGDKYAKFSANYGILFNTPSLLQLAQKAFDLREFKPYVIQLPENIFMDPYRENVFFRSIEAYKNDYWKHIDAVRRSLLECEVFIFTAGLNECWQLEDGTVLSRNPRQGFHHMIKHRTLTVQENVDNMTNFYLEVKKRNPNFKMVLTLSPIPLLATGRAETHHIIEANTHSKAVLRVAVEEVVSKFEDVYYLPSYELVTECTPDAWLDDHRHVTRETVDKVIEMFKEMYYKD